MYSLKMIAYCSKRNCLTGIQTYLRKLNPTTGCSAAAAANDDDDDDDDILT